MAQYEDDFDFEDEDENLPKKLRSQIKQLQAERKELLETVEGFRAEQRKTVLGGALESRGLNPKIAAFVPSDLEPDAIDGWLDEYAEVFGGARSEPAAEEDPRAAQTQRMAAAEQGAESPVGPNDILGQIDQAENMDELMSILRSQ